VLFCDGMQNIIAPCPLHHLCNDKCLAKVTWMIVFLRIVIVFGCKSQLIPNIFVVKVASKCFVYFVTGGFGFMFAGGCISTYVYCE